jgi:large subunit ribosomal protein L16
VAVVRPGVVLFELGGVQEILACEALRLAAAKLGIATCLIRRHAAV